MSNQRPYRTVMNKGSAEQTIERSRFICHVSPAESREEAEAFISEIRKEYKDATHNVPAMVIGPGKEVQWCSDDGEPQGTSGAPMVHMLVEEDITNVVVVVTRYFGGIKLGTGGLVRAYTSSARLGIKAAGLCRMEPRTVLRCRTDYKSFNRIQAMDMGLATMDNVEYTEDVTFDITCSIEESERYENLLVSAASGDLEVLGQDVCMTMIPEI